MRLDKFLSNSLRLSRAEIPLILKQNRVSVNGAVIKKKDFKIDENKDEIKFDGNVIKYKEFIYFVMNKPKGVVSARVDNIDKTVVDLIETDYVISPVGRLDKDTTGLLLLTNDGALLHALTSPQSNIVKQYYVESDKELDDEEMFLFENGIEIRDGNDILFNTKPASIVKKSRFQYVVSISEGKFHQVKRMFKYFNANVIDLKRLSFGPVKLTSDLEEGKYRELTEKELDLLKKSVKC